MVGRLTKYLEKTCYFVLGREIILDSNHQRRANMEDRTGNFGLFVFLLVMIGFFWMMSNDIKKQNTQFVTKIVAENNISYDTEESTSTVDYDILVRDGDKNDEKKFKITDRYSGKSYYFVMNKENNIKDVLQGDGNCS
jgi:hypothetical protein